MSKFSSGSDQSSGESRKRRKTKPSKSKVRSRSSSSSSSDSHYSYHKRSTKRKRTDRRHSRSHSKTSHSKSKLSHHSKTSERASSRSSSKSRISKNSRERNRSKSKEKSRRRSSSRSYRRSKSRSKERSKIKFKSSSESQSSPDLKLLHNAKAIKQEPSTQEQLQAKLQKAIKAAQTADDQLRQQGLLSVNVPTRIVGEVTETPTSEPLSSVLEEINDSSFVPKQFISSKSNLRNASNIADPPNGDMPGDVQMAPVNLDVPESIFHASLFVDPSQKLDKWVKKLFHLRQKAINGEPMVITLT